MSDFINETDTGNNSDRNENAGHLICAKSGGGGSQTAGIDNVSITVPKISMGTTESAVNNRCRGGSSRTASIDNVGITIPEIQMGTTESVVNDRSGGGISRSTSIENFSITTPKIPMGSAESAVDVRSGGGSSRTATIDNVGINLPKIPMGSTESAVNLRSGGGSRRTTRIDNAGITLPEMPAGSSVEARTDIIDQLKVDNDSETAGIALDMIGETDVVTQHCNNYTDPIGNIVSHSIGTVDTGIGKGAGTYRSVAGVNRSDDSSSSFGFSSDIENDEVAYVPASLMHVIQSVNKRLNDTIKDIRKDDKETPNRKRHHETSVIDGVESPQKMQRQAITRELSL
jgi:hypothetical protein